MRHYFILLLTFLSSIAYAENYKTDSIDKRVNELEKRIIRTEALQEATKNSVTETKDVFLIFTIIFTVLTATFGVVQFFKNLKESKNTAEKSRETEEKYNELLDKSKENIVQITHLIGSIDKMFVISQQTAEIENNIKKLSNEITKKDADRKRNREEKLLAVNKQSMDICLEINKDNFKEIKHQNIIQKFCQSLNSTIQEFDIKNDVELNANCDLLFSLDYILSILLEEALVQLDKAIRKAERFSEVVESEALYPEKNNIEIKIWNKKLANICLFHKAIIKYNFGDYKEAEALFHKAIEYDPRDVKSMLYIPEAKFLGKYDKFENIISDFNQLKEKITAIDNTEGWRQNKDQILSEFYLKYGNCYFPSKNGRFEEFQSLKKAGEKYRLAYKLNPNSYITKFSLAQALSLKSKSELTKVDKDEIDLLFAQVYEDVRIKTGEKTEKKILIMLHYILAICAKKINRDFKQHIMSIYENGGQLPALNNGKQPIRIYSSFSKNDLTYEELKKELKEFENNFNY